MGVAIRRGRVECPVAAMIDRENTLTARDIYREIEKAWLCDNVEKVHRVKLDARCFDACVRFHKGARIDRRRIGDGLIL